MKRHILSVCLLTCCVSAGAQNVHSHSACDDDSINSMKEAILSEVTVTGLTGTQRMKDSPIAFSVISPKKLHHGVGTHLVDVIANQPGLAQISTGAGISKPVIRGLGYNRVVVVEQGIRQEGQQWGDEHGLEVDAEGVHSVEILKGPASLMYGSDAIAGVMILHPEPTLAMNTLQAKVGGEYQTNNGLYNYHAGFAGNVNGWLWNWHYNDKAAHCYQNARDGYVPGSWYKERDILGMLGVSKGWGHSWLRFSHVNFTPGITENQNQNQNQNQNENQNENGKAPFLPVDGKAKANANANANAQATATPHSYSRQLPFQRVLHTKVVSDNVWYLGNGSLKAIVGYQQNFRREFEEDFNEAELAMRLHTANYDIKYSLPLEHDWNIATGINGMWQKNVNEAEETLIPDYHLFDFGYFATADKVIGRWHLSGGARVDNRQLSTKTEGNVNTATPSASSNSWWGFSGSLGAVYNLNDKTNLRMNVARGFRAPTVSELYSDGVHEGSIQYELGNSHLKAENSTQIDLGMDYTSHLVSLQAAVFCNWVGNYIFLGRLPYDTEDYHTYQYRQGNARLVGGEVSLDIHPWNPLHIENSFSYVRGVLQNQPSDSRNLPMMPAPRWNCHIRYELPDFAHGHCSRSFISLGMDYNLRQKHFYALDDTETATPSYAIFNLSAGMDLHVFGHNCIELSLCCQNLFDKVYQSHLSRLKYAGNGGISAMGRNVCLKINVPIDIHL